MHELAQHIYTTDSYSFETIALTSGIDKESLAALEAKARHYPATEEWKGDTEPLIWRAFPMSGGRWNISRLVYTGRAFNRAEGNYLAHSYVIPQDLAQEGSVAWIAACLPLWSDFKRMNHSSVEPLDPLPYEVDSSGQFPFTGLIAREMGKVAFDALLAATVTRLAASPDEPASVLNMPAPHPDLAQIFTGNEGIPKMPDEDELRLWRLMAMLAVLPDVFRIRASFSVNETSMPNEASMRPVLLVLRQPGELPSAPPSAWRAHCFQLAESHEFDELRRLQAWLSFLLVKPSVEGLELAFQLHQNIHLKQASQGIVAIMAAMERHYEIFNVERVYEEIRLFALGNPMHVASWLKVHKSICVMLDRLPDSALPPHFIDTFANFLKPDIGLSLDERVSLFRGLSRKIRMAVWEHIKAINASPAKAGNQDDWEFILRAVDPGELPSLPNAETVRPTRTIRWGDGWWAGGRGSTNLVNLPQSTGDYWVDVAVKLADWLKELVAPPRSALLEFEEKAEWFKNILAKLLIIGKSEISQKFYPYLAQGVLQSFFREKESEFNYNKLKYISHCLPYFLKGSINETTTCLLVELSIKAASDGMPLYDIAKFVSALPREDWVRAFIGSLKNSVKQENIRRFIALELELRNVIGYGNKQNIAFEGHKYPLIEYCQCCKYLINIENSRFHENQRNDNYGFFEQFKNRLFTLLESELDIQESLRVGMVYFLVQPANLISQDIAYFLIQRIDSTPGLLAQALVQEAYNQYRYKPLFNSLSLLISNCPNGWDTQLYGALAKVSQYLSGMEGKQVRATLERELDKRSGWKWMFRSPL